MAGKIDMFTIIQGPLQDGWRAAPSISDTGKRQDLDLIQDVLAQTTKLDTVAGVAFHRPEVGSFVRVLFLIHHLRDVGDVSQLGDV